MNFQEFQIINHFGNVDACCQFKYRGFDVSMSTLGRSKGACPTPVAVFKGDKFSDIVGEFHTVEDAIKFIDGDHTVTNLLDAY